KIQPRAIEGGISNDTESRPLEGQREGCCPSAEIGEISSGDRNREHIVLAVGRSQPAVEALGCGIEQCRKIIGPVQSKRTDLVAGRGGIDIQDTEGQSGACNGISSRDRVVECPTRGAVSSDIRATKSIKRRWLAGHSRKESSCTHFGSAREVLRPNARGNVVSPGGLNAAQQSRNTGQRQNLSFSHRYPPKRMAKA